MRKKNERRYRAENTTSAIQELSGVTQVEITNVETGKTERGISLTGDKETAVQAAIEKLQQK